MTTAKPPGTVLILGARSDIGRALARAFGMAGHRLMLAARHAGTLEADAQDLRLRCKVPVSVHEFDVLATEQHAPFLDSLEAAPDTVICVAGLMTAQDEAERDFGAAELMMRTNYLGPASILGEAANRMEARGNGTIIGISSVAGERGRASNYIYGSSKAGLTAFLSGLRNRLARKGVHVITIKPGFVATRMTEGMKLPAALTAQPAEVAAAILRAAQRGKDVVYTRPIWRLILWVISMLPEPVFKRTRL
jgi:short-subunit dehydrogenase